LSVLALVLFSTESVRAGDKEPPPTLHDLGTGEEIAANETIHTKNYGAVVKSVRGAVADLLRPGDIIVGLDGWRTFGYRDYQLARFKQPLDLTMTLLVNRDGDFEKIKISGLKPGRDIGAQIDHYFGRGRFGNTADALGLALDGSTGNMMQFTCAQAAASLEQWMLEAGDKDTAWLKDFIALTYDVQKSRFASARIPTHEPPVAFFKRLEKFLLSVVERNKTREQPPDWKALGESAEYFVLNYPIPGFASPPLGTLKLSDKRFQSLLEKRTSPAPHNELRASAEVYTRGGDTAMERALNYAKAALIDPQDYDMWAYASPIVWDPKARQFLLAELNSRRANTDDPDWPLIAYASVGPLVLDMKRKEAAEIVSQLGKQSPYLGWRAIQTFLDAAHDSKSREKGLEFIEKAANDNDYFMGSGASQMLRWALQKMPPIVAWTGEVHATNDPTRLLLGAPYSELLALTGSASKAQLPVRPDSDDETDGNQR
jgi:hypothetical protein